MKVSNRILAARMARRFNPQGLTLIELLVVLVILIALAGILIPQLPNMLTRSHTAAASTNIPEANKAIQEFEQIYFKQPANLDNLVTGGALATYLPSTTDLTATALTAGGTADALVNAGITSLAGLATATTGATFSPTFSPYDAANDVALTTASTDQVAIATEATVESLLRPDAGTGDIYVAFGIGSKSELIGRTINEAPYHFGDTAGTRPDVVYARYVAIYKVADADAANTVTPLEAATFIGTLAIHPDGLANVADDLGEFFEANQL